MAETILFISRHRIKEGKLEELRQLIPRMLPMIEADKPRTVLFHSYLSENEAEVSFIHVFPDAEAMDLHLEGAEQRSAAAYEFFQPLAFTIYGSPSQQALDTMSREAQQLKAQLTLLPRSLGGFIRLG
jgi:quinol monooxygenase YgiN